LTTDRGDIGLRLDLVVRRHLTDVDAASRTRVQAWIENGQVAINGSTVRRVSTRAAPGDVVTLWLPQVEPRRAAAAEDVALTVLFEDAHLLVLDKPAGVVVHPTYRHAAGTLMNALLWHARAWPVDSRPSLVGRLDKLTSGIVVVAKSASVHATLQREMRSNRSEKDYLAVVHGRVNVAGGEIALRLSHDVSDRRRVVASDTVGAPSVTQFTRLARSGGLSLLRCRLITGRTHQIRVHLSARGWPIVGDPVYVTAGMPGSARRLPVADPALAAAVKCFPRQALHAWRVAFVHPVTHDRVRIEAPIPGDIESLLTVARFQSASRSHSSTLPDRPGTLRIPPQHPA
jgi:23S rRNA pseudouridine1911/1915/1917 synthase